MSKVTDKNLEAYLEHYAREHNTDGVTLVMYKEQEAYTKTTTAGETETEETGTNRKDLRAYTWGRIKGDWYRIGYMDITPEQLQRLFTAFQIGPGARYGDVKSMFGKQKYEMGGDTKTREGEQNWHMYGCLIGVNFTNLFTGGAPPPASPSVVAAGLYNEGGRPALSRTNLMQPLPTLETETDAKRIAKEYAFGLSSLWEQGFTGMKNAVGFVTLVGREVTPEDEEVGGKTEKFWGGGALGRAGKIKLGERGMEAGSAAEKSWIDGAMEYTFAWQGANVPRITSGNELYTLAMMQIRDDESNCGLIGTMFRKPGELDAFIVGDWRRLSDKAAERSGQGSYVGVLAGVKGEQWKGQASGLWQSMEARWSLEKVTTELHDVEAELQELRTSRQTDELIYSDRLGTAVTRTSRIKELERKQTLLRTMQTALGIIEVQSYFGTAGVEWENLDKNARAGIEAIWGGPDQWSALVNGYVEVDKKFALAFNIQPAPWGSAGGKLVVPLSAVILALAAGEYWREDLKGPNANAGFMTLPDKDWGIGAIIGGMARTSSLEAADATKVSTSRNVFEGMVLGWMPWWRGAPYPGRIQPYVALSKEIGTNTYRMVEDLDTTMIATGVRLLWVGRSGVTITVDLEAMRKILEAQERGSNLKHYEQTTDQLGAEVKTTSSDDFWYIGGKGVVGTIESTLRDRLGQLDPSKTKETYGGFFLFGGLKF